MQVRQLTRAGSKNGSAQCGEKSDRAQLRRLLDQLAAGDLLKVK